MTAIAIGRRAASLATITLIALNVAACGGSAPVASTAATAGGPAAAGVVTLSGDETGTISKPGGCGADSGDPSSWNAIFQTDSANLMLDLTIEKSLVAGTYATGDHEAGKATVLLYAGGGGVSYDVLAGSGTVRVDAGSKSGSIEVKLGHAVDAKAVTIAGGWKCE